MVADRSVLVRLRADISDFQRKFAMAGTTTSLFVKNLESADTRMGNLVQTALALAPALVPISATAVPALAGLTTQATFAAAGVGVLVAAFNGIGTTLDAVNKYQLDPTDENLEKMREEMRKLPEEGRHMVRFLDRELMPALDWLQDRAAAGALPGFEDSLTSLLQRLPEASRLIEDLASASGELAGDAGDAIASDELEDFFDFLRSEAEPTLLTLGRTVGNVLEGLANTLVGLNPLANDFEEALYDWSRGFSEVDPEDFTEFVAYVRDVGPDALDALGALGSGFVALVKAAAPVGEVTLPVIEALANVIETIAESPAGPALIGTAAGVAAVSRAIALFQAANGSALVSTLQGVGKSAPAATSGLARMNSTISTLKTGAPILAGLALAYSDVDDKAGLSNTAMLATAGLLVGPWGAAVGAAIGLLLDWRAAGEQAEAQARAFDASLQGMTLDELAEGLEKVNGLLLALSEDSPLRDVLEERKQSIEEQIDATQQLAREKEAEHRIAAMAYAEEVGLALDAADATRMTTEQIKAQADALREVHDRADAVADSFLQLPESLNDAKVSLAEFITDMQESADALLNFNANSRKAAKEGLDEGLILSLRDAGVEGALRMRQLANATESEIARANKAHRTQTKALEQTRQVTEDLMGLSPVQVDVNAQTGRAMTNLRSLEAYLRNIKDEDVFVNVRHRQYGQTGGFGPVDSADGSMVPKDGGPYTDRFLYRLAPGEEIISNRYGQADAFRADRAAGRIPGYANGGTTGFTPFAGPGRPGASSLNLPQLPGMQFFTFNEKELNASLRYLSKVLEAQTAATEEATAKTEMWADRMAQAGQNTLSNFGLDLWGSSSNPWMAGAGGGPLFNLTQGIAGLEERIRLQTQLGGMGLKGDALSELLTGTNDEINAVIASGQIGAYSSMFSTFQGLSGQASTQAGQLAYGEQYSIASADQAAALAAQRATEQAAVKMEERLEKVQSAIERWEETGPERTGDAAAKGIKSGNNDKAREMAVGRPTGPRKPR